MTSARGIWGMAGCIAALAVAGCGSDGGDAESADAFEGEQREVAQVVEDLETATREGDIDRFCGEILSQKVVAQAERSGQKCRQQEGELRAELKRFGGKDAYDIEVKKVKVSGSEATADVEFKGSGDKRTKSTLTLLKEGDQWGIGVRQAE